MTEYRQPTRNEGWGDSAYGPPPVQQPPKHKRGWVKWAVIGAVFILLTGSCLAFAAGMGNEITRDLEENVESVPGEGGAADDVEVAGCSLDGVTGWMTAVLAVTNSTDKTADYVITVSFENKTGQQLASGNGVVQGLASGQTTKTDAGSTSEAKKGTFTCRVVEVTRL
jgi:hypothetical protein